jgi:osmotically-inducible protein OsmY
MDRPAETNDDLRDRTPTVGRQLGAVGSLSEPLADRIGQALRGSGYAALGSVDIAIDEGHVTLRGPVRSFHQKQIATSIVLPLDGVKGLSNELTVTR